VITHYAGLRPAPPQGTSAPPLLTVLNVGGNFPSIAHFHVVNATPAALRATDATVVMLPSSQVPRLRPIDVRYLHALLRRGTIVIVWADGRTSVDPDALGVALGYTDPQATDGYLFATAVAMRQGRFSPIDFIADHGVTAPLNLLGEQGIAASLETFAEQHPAARQQENESGGQRDNQP